MFKLIFVMSLLVLSSCGLKLEEGGTEAQDILQTKSLINEYTQLTGDYVDEDFYDEQNDTTRKVIIKLFIIAEQIGTGNYGEPNMFPALKANYRVVFENTDNPFIGSLTLNVRYIPENNNITLGNPVAPPQSGIGNSVPMFSLKGTLKNGVLSGYIYNHYGRLGKFTGPMTVKDNSYTDAIRP